MSNKVRLRLLQVTNDFNTALQNYPDDHERPAGIHASELGKCKRMAVYTTLGTEKKGVTPVEWKKRFLVGQAMHEMIQDTFSYMAKRSDGMYEVAHEVKIRPTTHSVATKWGIYSSIDTVVSLYRLRTPEEMDAAMAAGDLEARVLEERMIVEIKTKAPSSYAKMTAPEPAHVRQAHVYMACTGIKNTWLLYWDKGSANYTPSSGKFLVEFDPAIWQSLEQEMEQIWSYFSRSEEGNSAPREEGVQCEFCPYAWDCQPAYLSNRKKT